MVVCPPDNRELTVNSIAFLWLVSQAMAATDPVLLKDVRLVDARGDQGIHDVWIEDGRIAGIDPEMVRSGAKILQGEGLTVLPGLIDSHVHITQHPLSAWSKVPEEDETEYLERYLRSYLAWGVTTILDPGISSRDIRQIRSLTNDAPGPDIQVLGPMLSPANGYPGVVFPEFVGISTVDQLAAYFDEFEDLSPLGAKLTMEDGLLRPLWPLFSEQMLQEIQSEAQERGVPLYIHAMDAEMTRKALELQPHCLVHAPSKSGQRLARQIARSEAYVMSTLAIQGGIEWMSKEKAWERKRVKRSVPRTQRVLITDPDTMERTWQAGLDLMAPGLSQKGRELLIPRLKRSIPRRIERSLDAVGRLNEAGVPLVLGSDAGGSPVLPWLVHGPTTHMELHLLQRAGLEPLEIIRAATLTPAEMMGLDQELGTIEVGKRADLIVLEGNPLTDLENLARPRWVIRNGDLRTPKEWLQEGKP
jgi:imidazolonepropionase-like amidohydrolase